MAEPTTDQLDPTEEYQRKFYVKTQLESGGWRVRTPHGLFVYDRHGGLLTHMQFGLDNCPEADDDKHVWNGTEIDNGFGPSATCSLCGCNYATYLMHTAE